MSKTKRFTRKQLYRIRRKREEEKREQDRFYAKGAKRRERTARRVDTALEGCADV